MVFVSISFLLKTEAVSAYFPCPCSSPVHLISVHAHTHNHSRVKVIYQQLGSRGTVENGSLSTIEACQPAVGSDGACWLVGQQLSLSASCSPMLLSSGSFAATADNVNSTARGNTVVRSHFFLSPHNVFHHFFLILQHLLCSFFYLLLIVDSSPMSCSATGAA